MNKRNSSAGTTDEQRTDADSIPSASLAQNGLLSDAVQEGNILIGEFMGRFDFSKAYCRSHGLPEYKPEEDLTEVQSFKYHSSWDWLMPVVEKIEKDISKEPYYGFTVRIADRCCLIACHERNKQDGVIYQTPWGFRPLLKIQAVWLAVVEFIQWYNKKST